MSARRPKPDSDAPVRPSSRSRRVNVRDLNLPQLHRLAQKGSSVARAELERRMGEPERTRPAKAVSGSAARADAPVASVATRAAAPQPLPSDRGVSPIPTQADQTADPETSLAERLALIERQTMERSRADGVPQLIGLILLGWGGLLSLGGLALLGYGGGPYYLLGGLGCGLVGWMLLQRSRWALWLQILLLIVAGLWAWQHAGMAGGLVQLAPLLVPALWLLMPSVRDPLR